MKFAISDLLWTTTSIAILFAVIRLGPEIFTQIFVFLHILQFVVLPLTKLLTTVLLAEQRGQMLDIATNPAWRILKKLWLSSSVCTIAIWLYMFVIVYQSNWLFNR